MIQTTNTKEFYETLEKHDVVLVYWFTKWCPDCFVIKPHLPRLEKEYPSITFVKMDRDDDIELAKHFEIFGIPYFTLHKKEEEIGRLVNKKRKTYEEVKSFIDQYYKG